MSSFASPDTWGSSAWVFIHCIANTYPENPSFSDRIHYEKFFETLQYVLPCKLCRSHYYNWLEQYPIKKYLKSRKELKEWVFMLHNFVNLRLNKQLIKDCKIGDEKIIEYCKKKN